MTDVQTESLGDFIATQILEPFKGVKKVPAQEYFTTTKCPLMAISGHTEGRSRTSALPPIADIQVMMPRRQSSDVRFTPKSGHWRGYR